MVAMDLGAWAGPGAGVLGERIAAWVVPSVGRRPHEVSSEKGTTKGCRRWLLYGGVRDPEAAATPKTCFCSPTRRSSLVILTGDIPAEGYKGLALVITEQFYERGRETWSTDPTRRMKGQGGRRGGEVLSSTSIYLAHPSVSRSSLFVKCMRRDRDKDPSLPPGISNSDGPLSLCPMGIHPAAVNSTLL